MYVIKVLRRLYRVIKEKPINSIYPILVTTEEPTSTTVSFIDSVATKIVDATAYGTLAIFSKILSFS